MWTNRVPSRLEWELEMQIATIAASGVILRSGSSEDSLELAITDGRLHASVSLGGEHFAHVELKSRANDGEWRRIRLSYAAYTLSLAMDGCDLHLPGSENCSAEAKIPITERCQKDFATHCHRFLDLPPVIQFGGATKQAQNGSDGFVGCLRHVHLDGQLIHFSQFDSLGKVGDVQPGCEKHRPDKCFLQSPTTRPKQASSKRRSSPISTQLCYGGGECLDRWMGHHCRCANRLHSRIKACSQYPKKEPISLISDSYVVYEPALTQSEEAWRLYFEFLTTASSQQVMAMEFEDGPDSAILSIHRHGKALLRLNNMEFSLLDSPPNLSDGKWHSFGFSYNASSREISLIVDELCAKTKSFETLSLRGPPKQIYAGLAPSTSHPSSFTGCLRNVELNDAPLELSQMSLVEDGCSVGPQLREALRRIDPCSIESICLRHGSCLRTDENASHSYECLCRDGWEGRNCDRPVLRRHICPSNWWGTHPQCRECACSVELGFSQQCSKATGQCICRAGTFLPANSSFCRPCECSFGALNDQCDPRSGQCQCRGDSAGLACDSCKGRNSQLNRRTLLCEPLPARCPPRMERGVNWPGSHRSTVVRQPCPDGQLGIATRRCQSNGRWGSVDDFNCTLAELYHFDSEPKPSPMEAVRRLLNLTQHYPHRMEGRNLEIMLERAMELMGSQPSKALLPLLDRLFLHRQGKNPTLLWSLREMAKGMLGRKARPFVYQGHRLTFYYDAFNNTSSETLRLPQFKHFAKQKRQNGAYFALESAPKQEFRYAIFVVDAEEGSSSVVGLALPFRLGHIQAHLPFGSSRERLELAQLTRNNKWRAQNGHLRDNDGAILALLPRLSRPFELTSLLPFTTSAESWDQLAANGLLLLSLPLSTASIWAARATRSLLKLAVAMAFMGNWLVLSTTTRLEVEGTLLCGLKNGLIVTATTALLTILLLHSVQIHCFLMKMSQMGEVKAEWIALALALPLAFGTATFATTHNCLFSIVNWQVWLMVGAPGVLLLLNFYCAMTTLLSTCHKEYKLVGAETRELRRRLLGNAILITVSTAYSVSRIYAIINENHYSSSDLISNILLCLASAYLLYWAWPKSPSTRSNTAQKPPPKSSPTSSKPRNGHLPSANMRPQDGRGVYKGLPNEWMPDVIPSETYVHHTLQRSLGSIPRASPRTTTNASPSNRGTMKAVPQILSPLPPSPRSVTLHQHAYSTLARRSPKSHDPQYGQRTPPTATSTLSLRRNSNGCRSGSNGYGAGYGTYATATLESRGGGSVRSEMSSFRP